MKQISLLLGASALVLMGLGCSSSKTDDSTSTSTKSDSGTTTSGTDDTSTDGDAGVTDDTDGSTTETSVELNGCTAETYDDQTDDSAAREVIWDINVNSTKGKCMAIKEGQKVTFKGNFSSHPLKAQGGDSPNPISTKFDEASGTVDFTGAKKDGVYGWICEAHGGAMTGAIYVVP